MIELSFVQCVFVFIFSFIIVYMALVCIVCYYCLAIGVEVDESEGDMFFKTRLENKLKMTLDDEAGITE